MKYPGESHEMLVDKGSKTAAVLFIQYVICTGMKRVKNKAGQTYVHQGISLNGSTYALEGYAPGEQVKGL